jgi:hypothetical protein
LRVLLDEPEEAVQWLMEGRLPLEGWSLLAGKPKAGKTTMARCLALKVARGESFLGCAIEQGPVIYIALEEKRAEVRRHFRVMGATGDEEIYIYAATAPSEALERLQSSIHRIKPMLVIIDPLFRWIDVRDGNDYATMTKALEPLLALARGFKAHVLCVHHLGKGDRVGGDAILGSTAIFGAVDTVWLLKRFERCRTLSSIQRYGDDLEETVLCFDKRTETITLGETKEREEVNEMKKAVADFLEKQDSPASEPEIKSGVEGNNRHKQTALRELVNEGTVTRQGKGARGDPFTYSLTHSSIYQKCESENPGQSTNPTPDREYSHFNNLEISADPQSEKSRNLGTGDTSQGEMSETSGNAQMSDGGGQPFKWPPAPWEREAQKGVDAAADDSPPIIVSPQPRDCPHRLKPEGYLPNGTPYFRIKPLYACEVCRTYEWRDSPIEGEPKPVWICFPCYMKRARNRYGTEKPMKPNIAMCESCGNPKTITSIGIATADVHKGTRTGYTLKSDGI